MTTERTPTEWMEDPIGPAGSETPARPSASPRFDLWRVISALAFLGALPTLGTFGARWYWALELLTHFRVYYLLYLAPLSLLLLCKRGYRKWSLIPAACLAIHLWAVLPAYIPVTQPAGSGPVYRGMIANVYTRNRNYALLREVIEREEPDFFLLMEVDALWMEAMRPLESIYPHVARGARSDNFGIAMYTKIEPVELRIRLWGEAGVPSVYARLRMGEQIVTIVGTHPLPPGAPERMRLRDEQLDVQGNVIAKETRPVMLCGDLNSTPWSPVFHDLLKETNLRDTRRGFGILPSWCGRKPYLWLPIDHFLVSAEFAIRDLRIGPDIGSDHRPVMLDFQLVTP